MDVTEDTLGSGRKFRTANLKDDCTRERPMIRVDFSLPARRITLMLDEGARERGYSDLLVVDNDPEFTGRGLENWAHENGVRLFINDPSKARGLLIRFSKGKRSGDREGASRCRTARSRASISGSRGGLPPRGEGPLAGRMP